MPTKLTKHDRIEIIQIQHCTSLCFDVSVATGGDEHDGQLPVEKRTSPVCLVCKKKAFTSATTIITKSHSAASLCCWLCCFQRISRPTTELGHAYGQSVQYKAFRHKHKYAQLFTLPICPLVIYFLKESYIMGAGKMLTALALIAVTATYILPTSLHLVSV